MLYHAVLFDLDGTLIESGPGIFAVARAVMAEMGIPDKPDSELVSMVGPPLADGFRDTLGIDEAHLDEALARYRELARTVGLELIKPYPGVVDMLKALRKSGVFVGVVTSKVTDTAKSHIARYGLAEYIDYVQGGIPNGSADKTLLLDMAKAALPQYAGSIVMVGDRRYDIEAAKNTLVPSVAVLYGYGSYEELSSLKPDYIVKSVNELAHLLS